MPQYTASTITDPVLDSLYETLRLYQYGARSAWPARSTTSVPACSASPAVSCTAPVAARTARS